MSDEKRMKLTEPQRRALTILATGGPQSPQEFAKKMWSESEDGDHFGYLGKLRALALVGKMWDSGEYFITQRGREALAEVPA